MTTPGSDEPRAPESASPPAAAPAAPVTRRPQADHPVVAWAKAIALGIGDTAKDMLEEGRRGAREAMDQGWDRFDQKTKHRRQK